MLNHLIAIRVPTAGAPDPSPEAPADLQNKVETILGLGMWIVIAACVAGVLLVAGRAALAFRRGELGESMGQLGGVAVACVLAGSAAGFVNFMI